MSAPALQLDRVDKTYNPRSRRPVKAVKAVSLAMDPGEIVALLGSSGCGKTSTLRMVAGFEEVTAGRIAIAGREIHRLPPSRRGVAMAFEGYSLYPPLTVRENITFALRAAGRPRPEIDRRLEHMARLLEIEEILERYPSSISGGQQQRASLGRALIREADLYLLDEPMGQLEPQLRAVLRGRLKHFLKEQGMSTILVTHDQTEANALADRIAVMEDGELQQFASPSTLKDRPANLFVGTFIGEPPMNVFEARAGAEQGRVVFDLGSDLALSYSENELAPDVRAAVLERREITVGVRPHAVHLGAEGLPARITSNQWLGDQTHIAAELGAGEAGLAGPDPRPGVVAVEHQTVAAAVGSVVRLAIAAADLHLFETDTGRAVAHAGQLA